MTLMMHSLQTGENLMTDSRQCSYCKVVRPITEFYKDRTKSLGVGYRCKDCSRERIRTYMADDYSKRPNAKEIHRRVQATFRARHPERNAIYQQSKTVPLDSECSRCGVSDVRLVGHHPDYTKPKEVITLCGLCHAQVHKELKYVTA